MEISKEVKSKCTNETIKDMFWALETFHKALIQCNESYISKNEVRIYIDNEIGFINFKKYKYNDYNKALIIFGNIEKDIMLNDKRRKIFDKRRFKQAVENRIATMMLNKMRANGSLAMKKDKEKQKRKRIPIDIQTYIS